MYRKELHDSDSGEMEYREFKMIIDSSKGIYEFMIAENERFINLSKGVFGDMGSHAFWVSFTKWWGTDEYLLIKKFTPILFQSRYGYPLSIVTFHDYKQQTC